MDSHSLDFHPPLEIFAGSTETHTALKLLYRPSRLNETAWIHSCLVCTYREHHPEEAPEYALRAVFRAAVDRLAEESPAEADLLVARYWKRSKAATLAEN